MIEAIQQGLKEDGYEVSIAKLCRWFGVPRRTFYYKPIKKAIPKLQERLVVRRRVPRIRQQRRLRRQKILSVPCASPHRRRSPTFRWN